MLWNQPPSKLEQARRAAAEAAQKAADAAQSAANTAAQSAQSLLSTASQSASVAGDAISARTSALLHRDDESVEAARARAIAAQKAADLAAKEAEAAARDAQRKAEEEIARYQRELARKRAEFEAQQEALAAHGEELAQTRDELARSKEEIRFGRKGKVKIEDAPVRPEPVRSEPVGPEPIRLEKAPVRFEVPDADEDLQLRVVDEREGLSPFLLILGGVVALGALAYFLVVKKRGSSSPLQSRLDQVKGGVLDKAKAATEQVSERASQPAPPATSGVETSPSDLDTLGREIDAVLPPTTSTVLAASEESGHAGDATVDGISVDPDLNPQPIDEASAAQHPAEAKVNEMGVNENEVAPLFAAEGAQHPNIFDKVTEVIGHAADATEHMTDGDKDPASSKDENSKSKGARKAKGS